MYIHDAHVHMEGAMPTGNDFLSRLDAAGIQSANVFSSPPEEAVMKGGLSFSERMRTLLECVKEDKKRLFPILWIYPYEKDAVQKAKDAVQSGVMGFKIICDAFYVYEPQVMTLVRTIAEMNKPILFHSGILWDGGVSSKYNRPLNWEALIEIPNLRFSLAHCSWPWHDECIALYGKFLNSYVKNPDCTSEMFLDMTPGTPPLYRRDLLTKLFCTGYDISKNLMFGTDCIANRYNIEWAKQWLTRDNALYDELEVTMEQRSLLYGKNVLRFLGVTETRATHISPTQDGQ